MARELTLTVAVPTYNMEKYLRQNLYSLLELEEEKIEVLILDNSSTDRSGQIADEFVKAHPQLFTVFHKENHGYGSSINLAIEKAQGRYLRIVDADDWVKSQELAAILRDLENCNADLVVSDYTVVDTNSGMETRIRMCPKTVAEGVPYCLRDGFEPFPRMHSTIFRVEFLRENKISLLENTFYVDEQLMMLTCLYAQSLVYYERDVYCYRMGDATQSVATSNMGKRYADRERELKISLTAYQNWVAIHGSMIPCAEQLVEHIGNHFTTLYMYVEPPSEGRALASRWQAFLLDQWPEMAKATDRKRRILALLNRFHLSGKRYVACKAALKRYGLNRG